ncbi:MAG: hypothetical protein WCA80_05875, partial [Candidatus Aquilonibacter sp.]
NKLEQLYKKYNGTFTDEKELASRMSAAFDRLFSFGDLWKTSAMKPFMAYSLILAIMHVQGPIESLQSVYPLDKAQPIDELSAMSNVSSLVDEFDNKEDNAESRLYSDFVEASDKGTNVKAKRETRVRIFVQRFLESSMRPTSDLPRLSGVLQHRLRRLTMLFRSRPLGANAASEADRIVSYCTIELANAWLQFVRCYYLSCAVGARQACGKTVKHSGAFATPDDALVHSATIMGKRVCGKVPTPAEEPDWISPPTIIKLSRSLKFTNPAEIAAAFGITTAIFQPLTTCRNFYAHRSERAA